jgi:hypothetical protein
MTTSNYVKIFDTTLRDGEQSPGFSLTSSQIATDLSAGFTRFMIGANVAVLVPAGLVAWLVHEKVMVESKTVT